MMPLQPWNCAPELAGVYRLVFFITKSKWMSSWTATRLNRSSAGSAELYPPRLATTRLSGSLHDASKLMFT